MKSKLVSVVVHFGSIGHNTSPTQHNTTPTYCELILKYHHRIGTASPTHCQAHVDMMSRNIDILAVKRWVKLSSPFCSFQLLGLSNAS